MAETGTLEAVCDMLDTHSDREFAPEGDDMELTLIRILPRYSPCLG